MQRSKEILVCVFAAIPHPRNSKGQRKPTKRTPILLLLSLWFSLASSAFAVTEVAYVDGTGHQRIYAFDTGSNGHLKVNYWDGFAWHWADQGLPAGASAVYTPTAITYVSGGQQRIYVFAAASNGHLVVNYWDGSGWYWADQGLPPGIPSLSQPTAITYVSGGKQLIYVFGTTINYHLAVNYWDGSGWYWPTRACRRAAREWKIRLLSPTSVEGSNGSISLARHSGMAIWPSITGTAPAGIGLTKGCRRAPN